MEVGAYLVADPQSFELVQPGEGPLHHPAGPAQPRAVRDTSAGDLRCDAASPEDAPVLVVVVAAVGEQPPRPVTRPADQAADAGDRIQQRRQPGDVVPVSAGQGDGERGAVPVDDQVVLAARPPVVDRRRSDVSPPFDARICEPSIAQSSTSSNPALRSSAKSTSCRRGQMPPRSSPADGARPSLHRTRSARRIRFSSSRSCAARTRCPAEPHGHPPADARARDTGAAVADGAAAVGRYIPTGHQRKIIRHPQHSAATSPDHQARTSNSFQNDE